MEHARFESAVRAVLIVLTVVVVWAVPGCAPKVEPNEVDIMAGTTDADREVIKGHLTKAGINGEIVSVTDMGNEWAVGVGAPAPKPGQRPSAIMPQDYRVDKASGKVHGAPGTQ